MLRKNRTMHGGSGRSPTGVPEWGNHRELYSIDRLVSYQDLLSMKLTWLVKTSNKQKHSARVGESLCSQ